MVLTLVGDVGLLIEENLPENLRRQLQPFFGGGPGRAVREAVRFSERLPHERIQEIGGIVGEIRRGDFAAVERRDPTMGFLSSVGRFLGRAAGVVGRAIGVLPAATPQVVTGTVAAPVGRALAIPGTRTIRPGIAAAGGVAAGAGLGALAASAGDDEVTAMGGGNGRFRTVTTVTTFDRATGDVVRRKILQGSPHIMNRDLAIARRVLRTAGKMGRKFSRKTREPSKQKMLMDQIMDNAMVKAIAGGQLPVAQHAH